MKKQKHFHIKMSIYPQLTKIIEENFTDGEIELESYIIHCSLYYITTERRVLFLNKAIDHKIDDTIAAFCFEKRGVIFLIATSKEYQHQGYAKELLSTILSRLEKAKLNVRVSNKNAIKLYMSLGFKVTDVKENFYQYTGENEDAYEMRYERQTNIFDDIFDF